MNTAARMESKGVPGKIHISEAADDALMAEDKGSWVVKRTEEIDVKGKGKMQTYFAEPMHGTSSHASDFEAPLHQRMFEVRDSVHLPTVLDDGPDAWDDAAPILKPGF